MPQVFEVLGVVLDMFHVGDGVSLAKPIWWIDLTTASDGLGLR
jgi:hypothetical protein